MHLQTTDREMESLSNKEGSKANEEQEKEIQTGALTNYHSHIIPNGYRGKRERHKARALANKETDRQGETQRIEMNKELYVEKNQRKLYCGL